MVGFMQTVWYIFAFVAGIFLISQGYRNIKVSERKFLTLKAVTAYMLIFGCGVLWMMYALKGLTTWEIENILFWSGMAWLSGLFIWGFVNYLYNRKRKINKHSIVRPASLPAYTGAGGDQYVF